MEKQNLLVDCNASAIADRLQTTLENIHVQKGLVFWDDLEKIEHCIEALKIVAKEQDMLIKDLEEQGVLNELLNNYK
ncbi:MAG: hypothetical protein QNK68_06175 [Flavobacteriales bacterium]